MATLPCKQITINGVAFNVGNPGPMSYEKLTKLMGRRDVKLSFKRAGYDVQLHPGETVPISNGMKFKMEDKV